MSVDVGDNVQCSVSEAFIEAALRSRECIRGNVQSGRAEHTGRNRRTRRVRSDIVRPWLLLLPLLPGLALLWGIGAAAGFEDDKGQEQQDEGQTQDRKQQSSKNGPEAAHFLLPLAACLPRACRSCGAAGSSKPRLTHAAQGSRQLSKCRLLGMLLLLLLVVFRWLELLRSRAGGCP